MSRYQRTPTEITVTPLDMSTVETDALAYLRAHAQTDRDLGKDADMPSAVRAERYGIVETPQGLYALCTEGVGPDRPITSDKPLMVDVWIQAYERGDEGGPEFISLFPACQAKLDPAKLRERATDERVNLAEWVRTFGGRLDANYESWRRLLTQPVTT